VFDPALKVGGGLPLDFHPISRIIGPVWVSFTPMDHPAVSRPGEVQYRGRRKEGADGSDSWLQALTPA